MPRVGRLVGTIVLLAVALAGSADRESRGSPDDAVAITVIVTMADEKPASGGRVDLHAVPLTSVRVRSHFARRDPPPEDAPPPAVSAPIANGRTEFRGLPTGIWRAVIRVPGYASGDVEIRWARSLPTREVHVRLLPATTLKGRIVLVHGGPIADVEVAAVPVIVGAGHSLPRPIARARTDLEGRYRLADLGPGVHDLWTRRAGGPWIEETSVRVPAVTRHDIELTDGAIITGRVTARAKGKPVAGARVEVMHVGFVARPVAASWTTTGADGRYRLRTFQAVLKSGEVRVRAPGFAPARLEDERLWTLREGQTFEQDVALEVEATVRGRVTGPDGPVEGATVIVWQSDPETPEVYGRAAVATTADDGTYAVTGLGDRPAAIEVRSGDLVHPAWGRPVATHRRQAGDIPDEARLVLALGRVHRLDVALTPLPAGAPRLTEIHGVVRNEAGKPVPLAIVTAPRGARTLTDSEGRFRLTALLSQNQPVGHAIDLMIDRAGHPLRKATVKCARAASDRGVAIYPGDAPILRGTIVPVGESSPAGAIVHVGVLVKDRHTRRGVDWNIVPPATVAANGAYEIRLPHLAEVAAGTVGPATRVQNAFVVCAILPGQGIGFSREFHLEEGWTHYSVDVQLLVGAALYGTLTNATTGEPIAGATVRVKALGGRQTSAWWPPIAPPSTRTIVEAITNEKGRWGVNGLLPPGNKASSYDVVFAVPGYVRDTEFSIRPGGLPIDVALSPHHVLEGLVVDPGGAPVPDAKVWLSDEDGMDLFWSDDRRTDGEGRFRLMRVPAGTYTVRADLDEDDDRNFMAGRVEGVAAGRTDVKAALTPGHMIAGRITDAAARPVEGVVVLLGGDVEVERSARTNADGLYRLTRLPPGKHDVEIVMVGLAVTLAEIEVDHVLDYGLPGTLGITGRIRKEDFARLKIPFERHGPPMLRAEPVDGKAPEGETRRFAAYVADDGRFAFRLLPPGAYRIHGSFAVVVGEETRRMRVAGDVRVEAGAKRLVIGLLEEK